MNTDKQDLFKKGIRGIWIIWGAMLFSLYLYVKICHMIEPTLKSILGADFHLDVLKIILYSVCGFILIFSYYFRNHLMKPQSEKIEAKYFKRAAKTNSHPSIVKYGTAVIVSIAISESIGIVGFVLFLLSKDFPTLYILAGISAAAMLYHRPKMIELDKIASQMNNTQ